MDSVVTDVLEHLQGRLSDPAAFFEAVREDFQEHREDFDGFRSAFEGRGFGAAGEDLIRYLDDHGRLDLAAKIVEERPDELAAAYLGTGEAGAEQAGAPAGDEQALWQAAVDQFGGAWSAWDGTDEGWTEYRDWFYDATNTQDPGMYEQAYEHLSPLDDLDPAERIARMREFGFDVSGTEVPESPAEVFDEEQAAGQDTGQAPTESERVETYRALADDPAIEGISHEVLDELLADPDFGSKMAAARAAVDAEIEAALADEMSET
jgi:hypothetical protein